MWGVFINPYTKGCLNEMYSFFVCSEHITVLKYCICVCVHVTFYVFALVQGIPLMRKVTVRCCHQLTQHVDCSFNNLHVWPVSSVTDSKVNSLFLLVEFPMCCAK